MTKTREVEGFLFLKEAVMKPPKHADCYPPSMAGKKLNRVRVAPYATPEEALAAGYPACQWGQWIGVQGARQVLVGWLPLELAD